MKQTSFFSKSKAWLQSTEMFGRPSKQVPGKWQLFEYYFEPDKELINVKEDELKTKKEFLQIEFSKENVFSCHSNLTVEALTNLSECTWSISKNFISLVHPGDFRNNLEFQFAFEKGNLKLLKKDALGKIEFFGFFKRIA